MKETRSLSEFRRLSEFTRPILVSLDTACRNRKMDNVGLVDHIQLIHHRFLTIVFDVANSGEQMLFCSLNY